MARTQTKGGKDSSAHLGFEAQLWAAADKFHNNMDTTEYNVRVFDPCCGSGGIFVSDWGGENLRQDVRWKFGMPPVNNANYAWIQHFIHHLSPVGVAGFVMAKTTRGAHPCSMKITDEVRKYSADLGAEVYAKD